MSVKKEPSRRRSAPVDIEAPDSTQSAVARRAAEAQLNTLIAKLRPHIYGSSAQCDGRCESACPPPMKWCTNTRT